MLPTVSNYSHPAYLVIEMLQDVPRFPQLCHLAWVPHSATDNSVRKDRTLRLPIVNKSRLIRALDLYLNRLVHMLPMCFHSQSQLQDVYTFLYRIVSL